MKLALRNKLFSFISLSRIFNTLGASIFNIVFVVFASSMPNPKFAIAVANFIVLVPTFFTIFVGIKADKTIHKARWLIHFGYVQALLFILVAIMTRSSSYLAFSVVCFMNILSDIISDYRSGLQMPILKKNIPEQDLMEAFSFTQLISFLCSLAGQALGVWLLAISQQNFFLVALVNSLTFLLSSTTLYLVRRRLTHDPVTISENKPPLKEELKKMYTSSKLIFEQEGSNNFLKLLAQILVINAMAGSLIALYNLYLLDNPIFHLSFSQSLLILQTTLVLAMVIASLTPNDYFSRLSLNQLIIWAAVMMILLAISNFLHLPVFVGITFGFFLAYASGKINPKINTLLLSKLPSNVLAQTSSFLSLLFSFSVPLGTMIFSSLALWNMNASWLIFSFIGVIALLLSIEKKKEIK
ncbi:transporter [Streptococcus gordonii]|uniref:MFS transporter n=1 Tax=Streptococcus gordonii TaxID=1302 RepID=UPI000E4D29A3|nr:MFS transporter [Streptococcus gordonii]RHE63922.1 transporter [Streptococcus gordonii]